MVIFSLFQERTTREGAENGTEGWFLTKVKDRYTMNDMNIF